MTTRKDKNWRYESWATNRPSISKEEKKKVVRDFYEKAAVDKAYYNLAKPKAVKKAEVTTEPFYSDDYMDLLLSPEEAIDVQKQLNVSPLVRKTRPVWHKIKVKKSDLSSGLPNILLADASNKPPTLEDYLRLGITISQLSDEERKNIQWMLDRSMPKDKK
tara:strand:+ start:41 stop:523 length:483 start_codon:yes stop_codon:yes gene_type:complete